MTLLPSPEVYITKIRLPAIWLPKPNASHEVGFAGPLKRKKRLSVEFWGTLREREILLVPPPYVYVEDAGVAEDCASWNTAAKGGQ